MPGLISKRSARPWNRSPFRLLPVVSHRGSAMQACSPGSTRSELCEGTLAEPQTLANLAASLHIIDTSRLPDTVQLDYGNPATQTAMRGELLAAAAVCDGLRCDMAMLILPDVFQRTW